MKKAPTRTARKASQLCAAMSIAGSDNSGGAGIEADLKTFTTLGVYGTCAITCVVAEHPGCVQAVQAVRGDILEKQIALNLEAFPIAAIKTGMLYSTELISVILSALNNKKARSIPLVVDPVMIATSGAALLKPSAMKLLREELIPRATLITPNLDEARLLFEGSIPDIEAARDAAVLLSRRFNCAVLLKGGHFKGKVAHDFFAEKGKRLIELRAPFRPAFHTHGTGCTMSAAIAASLAHGASLEQAVRTGKKFVTRAITRGVRLGCYDVLNHLP